MGSKANNSEIQILVVKMKDELEKILRARSILLERVFPYEKAGLIQIVRAKGQLLEEEYRGDGIYVKAFVPAEIYGKVAY